MASSSASTTETVTHHPLYYHVDIFKVESKLFMVHRSVLLHESVVFESMFSVPPPEGKREGQSDDNPIVLEGVSAGEFEALLDYLHRGSRFGNDFDVFSDGEPIPNSNGPIIQDYIDLLSIASRFECPNARRYAIKGIDTIQPTPSAVQKIALADKYDISQWLLPSYVELCKRPEPLREDEAMRIGFGKTCLIAKAREIIRSSETARTMIQAHYYQLRGGEWPPNVFEDQRVTQIIMEVFWPNTLVDSTNTTTSGFG